VAAAQSEIGTASRRHPISCAVATGAVICAIPHEGRRPAPSPDSGPPFPSLGMAGRPALPRNAGQGLSPATATPEAPIITSAIRALRVAALRVLRKRITRKKS